MRPARILYVEDDEDVRDTMTMLLEHEGYDITAVHTAEAALDALTRVEYDLLLTDYQLPNENAEWLIRSALERGCLGDTPVIVLSGAHDPSGIEGYRFLRKPVGQEALLAAFDAAMTVRDREPVSAADRRNAQLQLTLYVSSTSQASRKARRNLALVLEGMDAALVDLVVHDVTGEDRSWEDPAEEDRIVVLPTLVRRAPAPKVWIAGDLSDVALVRDTVVPGGMKTGR